MSDLVTRAKELAVLAHEPMVPRKDMKRLYNAYVRLLESGRDRIRDLGGECDGVDVMERNDLDLRHARDVLTTPPRHPADEWVTFSVTITDGGWTGSLEEWQARRKPTIGEQLDAALAGSP